MECLKDFQLKVGKMDVLESRVEILSDPAVDCGYELMVRTVFVWWFLNDPVECDTSSSLTIVSNWEILTH